VPEANYKVLINDPLRGMALGKVTGGKFISTPKLIKSGWQAADKDCRIVYTVDTPIKCGYIEVDVTNLNPKVQQINGTTGSRTWPHRHHLIHANACPGLDHHALDKASSGIVLHLYRQSATRKDFKLMNFRYIKGDFEGSNQVWTDEAGKSINFDPKKLYTLRMDWTNGNCSSVWVNGVCLGIQLGLYDPAWAKESGTKPDTKFLAPRYFAIGSDLTHSIDRVDPKTMLSGNRYQTLAGPIYSNLKIVKT